MELLFDGMPGVWGAGFGTIFQGLADPPSLRETGRQIASILFTFVLFSLYLGLAISWDFRTANLAALSFMGLAYGIAFAIGQSERLEQIWTVVGLFVLVELAIAFVNKRDFYNKVAVAFVVWLLSASAGSMLATFLENAGPAGELILELIATVLLA